MRLYAVLVISFLSGCLGDTWTKWTTCSKSCGRGFQTRDAMCDNSDGTQHPCGRVYADCNIMSCKDLYQYNPWTPCNNACGGGSRSRQSSVDPQTKQIIPCHQQDCETPPGCGLADLVLVLDSSGSLGEYNWYRLKQFAIDLIKSFNISSNETRVGAVFYSTESKTPFVLNQYQTSDELEDQIWKLPYMAGTTNTADALRDARTMITTYSRRDVKNIVVAITDGASNVLPENTIPEANKLKALDVEVFCIGIGGIVQAEIDGIASKPLEDRAFTVDDVDSLDTISGLVVKGVCAAASTTPKAPVTADPEAISCLRCNYSVNGLGYLEDPLDCTKYYQCQKLFGGRHVRHHMPCPATLFWSQSYLTCVRNAPHAGCVRTANTATAAPSTKATCNLLAAEDQTKYIQMVHGNPVQFSCSVGLIFIQDKCRCGYPSSPLPTPTGPTSTCDQDLILWYPFDDDLHDHSCMRAQSTKVGDVSLNADAHLGKAAYFNGGRLEVPYMLNWFAGRQVNTFTVALWVKRTDTLEVVEGLVNNGDCEADPSMDVHVGPGTVSDGGFMTTGDDNINAFGRPQISSYEWHHIAMVYGKTSLTLYIDGAEVASEPSFQGYIENRQCPMNIGHRGKTAEEGIFSGYMDDIRIYKKTLTAEQVLELAQ